jgi:hypothetical protein
MRHVNNTGRGLEDSAKQKTVIEFSDYEKAKEKCHFCVVNISEIVN